MSKLLAARLGLDHISRTVTATQDGTTVTGPLQAVELTANLIDDTQFGDAVTRWAVGALRVQITVVPGISLDLDPRATVEVEL